MSDHSLAYYRLHDCQLAYFAIPTSKSTCFTTMFTLLTANARRKLHRRFGYRDILLHEARTLGILTFGT